VVLLTLEKNYRRLTNMTDMDFFQAEKVFSSTLAALIGSAHAGSWAACEW
jgi:hypothetical protein